MITNTIKLLLFNILLCTAPAMQAMGSLRTAVVSKFKVNSQKIKKFNLALSNHFSGYNKRENKYHNFNYFKAIVPLFSAGMVYSAHKKLEPTSSPDDTTVKALVNALAHVHQNTIDLFFKTCSPQQKKVSAVQLAQAAVPILSSLPPRVIICIAQADDEAALILAHAVAKQHDVIDAMCPHTIPMLAKINTQSYELLSPFVKEFSPLDRYLFTEHSGSGMLCATCNGTCKFKEDNPIESFAKLIKGVRTVVLAEDTSDPLALPADLKAMPEAQRIYSHRVNIGGGLTHHIWFTPEGEQQAKLFTLYHECNGDSQSLRSRFRSDYTFSKILGYKDEDIEFFYTQSPTNTLAGNNTFKSDKEHGDAWLLQAQDKLKHVTWFPKKLL